MDFRRPPALRCRNSGRVPRLVNKAGMSYNRRVRIPHQKVQQHSSSATAAAAHGPLLHQEHQCTTFSNKESGYAHAQQSVDTWEPRMPRGRTNGTSPEQASHSTLDASFRLMAAFSGGRLGHPLGGSPEESSASPILVDASATRAPGWGPDTVRKEVQAAIL